VADTARHIIGRHPLAGAGHIISISQKIGIEGLLEGFLYNLEAEGKSETTIGSYAHAVRRYVKVASAHALPTEPSEITKDHIRIFLAQLRQDGLAAVSCRDYMVSLGLFFKWLMGEGLLAQNPCDGIKTPRPDRKTKKGLTIDQVRDLIKVVDREPDNAKALRDMLIIYLLSDCGIRASELCDLELADVDVNRLEINIRQGKGRKQRRVAFGTRTRTVLWSYVKLVRGERPGSLIQGMRGQPLCRTSLAHLLNKLAQATDWPDKHCGPHKFRRLFAVESLRGGLDPFRVQLLLGHEKLDMTRLYAAELSLDDAIEAQRKVSISDRLK